MNQNSKMSMTPKINNNVGNNTSSANKIKDVQRNANLESAARAEQGRKSGNLGNSASNIGTNNRADDYKKSQASRGSGLPSKGTNTNLNQSHGNVKNNKGNLGNTVHQAKMMIAKEGLKAIGQKYGIPTSVTEKVLNSPKGQQMLNHAVSNSTLPTGNNLKKLVKPKSEKSLNEKSDDREEEKRQDGIIDFELSAKTIKRLAIMVPIFTTVLFVILIPFIDIMENKSSSTVLAGMASEDSEALEEYVVGKGSDDNNLLALGKGVNDYPDEYYDRLKALGNNFSTQKKCEGEECLTRSEFLYYLKIADIADRYKNKYNVTLDWFLISSTNLYFDEDIEDIMKANLSNYDKNSVTNYSILTELDWDTDFKNMPGYTYLDADDSRYDLNILAKNMVKKTTTQSCLDSSGNVAKSQVDTDVEDKYFASGGNKRLKCSSGQTYTIHSTYTKDMEKYDEFMLEYIDKKMNSKGTGNKPNNNSSSSSSSGTNMSSSLVNLALSQLNDPDAASGRKYWTWLGRSSRIEWCATFVSWLVAHTQYNGQSLNQVINFKSASVYEWVNHFYSTPGLEFKYNDSCSKYSGKNGQGNYIPKEGDLIFFDWDAAWDGALPPQYGPMDHIGIVQRVEDGKIITIEGNSDDIVAERSYSLSSCDVTGFGSWY